MILKCHGCFWGPNAAQLQWGALNFHAWRNELPLDPYWAWWQCAPYCTVLLVPVGNWVKLETSVPQCSAWNEDFNARECSWTHASSVPTWSCSQLRNWPDGCFARVQAAAEDILVIKHDVMTMEINENPPLANDFPWFSHSGDWYPSRSLHMDSSKWHELERGSSLFDFTIGSRGVAETAARCEQGWRVINVWQASWPAELFWKPRVSHWSHHLLSCYKRLKCLFWITNTTPFLFWNPEMPSPHDKLSQDA